MYVDICVQQRKEKLHSREMKMSSWLPSIFNSDDNPSPVSSSPRSPSAGVKEDLSTLYRGVAAFLSPPPPNSSSTETTSSSGPSADMIAGIKNDLAEIQGTFKSGLSLFSSKFTSNLLQFPREMNDTDDDREDLDEEEDGIVGITEEIVDFVSKISSRPELWTDFPISLPDDVDMSDYQREHASEIERLVPSLVYLRQKIRSQISHGKFWMIYFILLFPRLNEDDLKLLSTPEVVEMREALFQKLQNKSNAPQERFESSETVDSSKEDGGKEVEETTVEHNVSDKTVNATRETKVVNDVDSDHGSEVADPNASQDAPKESENEDNISFSDLDDDDNDLSDKLSGFKLSQSKKASSSSEAKEWVELNENSGAQDDQHKAGISSIRDKGSESEESNDWLTVDDTDIDNSTAV